MPITVINDHSLGQLRYKLFPLLYSHTPGLLYFSGRGRRTGDGDITIYYKLS